MNIIPTAIRNRCFRRTTASIRCVKVSKLCNWFKTKINLVVVRTFQYLMAWKTIRSLVFRKFQCFPTGNRSICARNGKEYFNLGEWCECEDIYIRWSGNLSLSLRIIKQFNEFIFICCHCKVLKSARWKALTYTAHSRRASFHLSIEKLYLPIQANVIIYIDSIN